jgi:phage tail-like protein
MTATSQRRDPFPVYCFRVEIDEIDGATAFFKSVSGLKFETDVVDFQEGGQNEFTHRLVGPTKWANLIFKRGFSQDNKLIQWRQEWITGRKSRRNGKIIQLNTKLEAVCEWRFKEGWPCKWELSEMDASKSELAIETLEIAHHGLQFG